MIVLNSVLSGSEQIVGISKVCDLQCLLSDLCTVFLAIEY